MEKMGKNLINKEEKKEKNLISKEEKDAAIIAIKSAAREYREETKGLNAFCNSLLASQVEGIKKTLQVHNLTDKKSIFTFLKDNALYVDHDGFILEKKANKDCRELKKFTKIENYSIKLLVTAVVTQLSNRKPMVMDSTLYYDAKYNVIDEKIADKKILAAKELAAAQAAQAAKIAEIKDKVYNDYISQQSKQID